MTYDRNKSKDCNLTTENIPDKKILHDDTYNIHDPGLRNFWYNPSFYYTLQMLNTVFAENNTFRKKFYRLMLKNNTKVNTLFDNVSRISCSGKLNVIDTKVLQYHLLKKLLSIICKINRDLIDFMITSVNINTFWWEALRIYKLTNSIFKN